MENKCITELKIEKKLFDNNILIVTDDYNSREIKTLICFLRYAGATINTTKDVSTIRTRFDCIIFDNNFKPKRKLWETRKHFKNFVSILFVDKKINEIIEEEYYDSFDSMLQSIRAFCPIKNNEECEGKDCIVYYQYIYQTLQSASIINKKRIDNYKKALKDFIGNFPLSSEYTFFTVIDDFGEIIAMDNTMKNIFGDLVGKHVEELDYDFDFKKVNIGDEFICYDKNGDEIKIRLVYSSKLINGTTYYLNIWEKAERVDNMNNIIDEMGVLNDKINHFREELYANSG